jgi:hypothetical protein
LLANDPKGKSFLSRQFAWVEGGALRVVPSFYVSQSRGEVFLRPFRGKIMPQIPG